MPIRRFGFAAFRSEHDELIGPRFAPSRSRPSKGRPGQAAKCFHLCGRRELPSSNDTRRRHMRLFLSLAACAALFVAGCEQNPTDRNAAAPGARTANKPVIEDRSGMPAETAPAANPNPTTPRETPPGGISPATGSPQITPMPNLTPPADADRNRPSNPETAPSPSPNPAP
jgi:hypothetical protein